MEEKISKILTLFAKTSEECEAVFQCKLSILVHLIGLFGYPHAPIITVTGRLKESFIRVDSNGDIYEFTTTNEFRPRCKFCNLHIWKWFKLQSIYLIFFHHKALKLHSAVYEKFPEIRCVIYVEYRPVYQVSKNSKGLLALDKHGAVLGKIELCSNGDLPTQNAEDPSSSHLGSCSKVFLLPYEGALCCGRTVEEAFFLVFNLIEVCIKWNWNWLLV